MGTGLETICCWCIEVGIALPSRGRRRPSTGLGPRLAPAASGVRSCDVGHRACDAVVMPYGVVGVGVSYEGAVVVLKDAMGVVRS